MASREAQDAVAVPLGFLGVVASTTTWVAMLSTGAMVLTVAEALLQRLKLLVAMLRMVRPRWSGICKFVKRHYLAERYDLVELVGRYDRLTRWGGICDNVERRNLAERYDLVELVELYARSTSLERHLRHR